MQQCVIAGMCCRSVQTRMGRRWLSPGKVGARGAAAPRKSENGLCCAAPVKSLQRRPLARSPGVGEPMLLSGTQHRQPRTLPISRPVQCGDQTPAMPGCRSALDLARTTCHRSALIAVLRTTCSVLERATACTCTSLFCTVLTCLGAVWSSPMHLRAMTWTERCRLVTKWRTS